jgi:hypothetical protein
MSNREAGQKAQKLISETLKPVPIPRRVSRSQRGQETDPLVAR